MLYPKNIEEKIGFDEIRKLLKGHCLSTMGVERVEHLQLMNDAREITYHLAHVQELDQILSEEDQLPGEDFLDLRPAVRRIRVEGTSLEEQEMWELKRSLDTMHSWIAIIRTEEGEHNYPALNRLAQGVFTFIQVTRRIDAILDKYGRIKDDASPELARLRRELKRTEGSVSHTLNSILRAAQEEGLIGQHTAPTLRDGRLVIPVAPAMKRRIRGIVHDESATGKTVFIEPAAVVEANNRIRELEADERREINRIMMEFTDSLRPNVPELLRAYEFLADLELVLAKVRLMGQLGGICPQMSQNPRIDWTMARHPLLLLTLHRQGKKVVPLDIMLNRRQRILIISGPNAGGKSVCLKTVGLIQYMAQCAIPVPLGENSRMGVFNNLFIDIGDEQSIEDDLSTYSSHLLNMKNMMKGCDPSSLLLIDEFGGGTEPTIGGAMAQAVLMRFVQRGAFGVITTHYQNLKHFADETDGVVNGAMLYDRHRMQALFQLEIGNPGSSFAVEIARKIGIPEDVIADATELVGKDYVNADKYLLDIVRDKRYWESKRQNIHSQEKQMEQTIQRYESEISQLQQQRREIIRDARQQAQQIVDESNARVENTIREIREAQAEKERTREVRQSLTEYRSELTDEKAIQHDDAIERKMRQIEERRKRKEERRNKKKNGQANAGSQNGADPATAAPLPSNAPAYMRLKVGDTCRMKGQTTVGVLEKIQGKRASVTFGMMRTVVELCKLEPAAPPRREEVQQDYTFVSRETREQMHTRQVNFRQDIDIRGMRADEALQTITYYIDDCIMVGASRVRILHGTGTGALRQLVRQYLRTVSQVSSARDEHVQLGGAGITVVEFVY